MTTLSATGVMAVRSVALATIKLEPLHSISSDLP